MRLDYNYTAVAEFLAPGVYRTKKAFYSRNSTKYEAGTLILVLEHSADYWVRFVAPDGTTQKAMFTFVTSEFWKEAAIKPWFEKVRIG